MIGQAVAQIGFDFFSRLPIVVEPTEVHLSSDAGILPIRQFDDQIGFTDRFIACLDDSRHPHLIDHPFHEMVRQRIYGILAGDRLSCHRFLANYFRLQLHCAALNLLIGLRPVMADPPTLAECGKQGANQVPVKDPSLPVEALAGKECHRCHNYRRRLAALSPGVSGGLNAQFPGGSGCSAGSGSARA